MKLLSRFKNLMLKFRSRVINNKLSLDLSNKLIEDRVDFKFYAVQQVLDRLKHPRVAAELTSSLNSLRTARNYIIITLMICYFGFQDVPSRNY